MESPILCSIDPELKQSEIDDIHFEQFPNCQKCNPNGFVISW